MASSSSSHQQNQEFNVFSGIEPAGKRRKVSESSKLFDVFINHRGPDVKATLATQLYNSLAQLGIRAFLDSEEKELGISFPSTIETAICSAKVHIAIFSKTYAESPWCLAELLLMLQSTAKIIPVFYEVKPSDLRYIERGAYAEAFLKYEKKGRYMEKLTAWKEALQCLSFIAGPEFNSEWDCRNIVAAVLNEVQRKTFMHVAEYPVGLNELVQDLEDRCGLGERKHKNKAVGIFGMGGSGKTTLAKELCNRKCENYRKVSFLFDVRENFATSQLHSLQRKLLKDLFDDDRDLSFTSVEEGTNYLKDRLRRSPPLSFLIIVDDIDHVEQLNALLVMDFLNKSGNSLVIVTTRDVGVLISAGITVRYNVKGIDRNDARELFCWHAFCQAHPCSGYEVLVDSFVEVCVGSPLSLRVLGRHVHGRDHRFWESELIKARKTLPQDIKQRLKISLDALDVEEKQVFMDISCFFVGKQTSTAEKVLEGSGWNAYNAMERLKDKCLLEKGGPVLRMHDHLRDLGREMALEIGLPHRLWRPQDLQFVESMGFKTMLTKTNIRCFHSFFDNSMDCRVTFFLGQPDTWLDTSASLLWLQLESSSSEQRSIPSWIPLQNLQGLIINFKGLKTLWENHTQAPSQLKELQICRSFGSSECPALEELTLERLSFLENITIQNCNHLKSVLGLSNLASLVELEISYCSKLVFENLTLSGMKCLERITFSGELHLKYFRLNGCPKLKALLGLGYNKLVELSIRDCPELEWVPVFSNRNCVETIIIDGCRKLQYFQLRGCTKLKIVSVNFDLRELLISNCPKLEALPSLLRLNCLKRIVIDSCEKLENLTVPTTLSSLSLKSCRDLQKVAGTGDLMKLEQLIIKECPELQELPSLAGLSCLQEIMIDSCEKLQNIAGIEDLQLRGMRLSYCGDALIRNCIHKLKCVPSYSTVLIGKAVDGVELSLNQNLFSDSNIGVHGVTEIGSQETYTNRSELGALIGCFLVVVDSSTSVKDINKLLPFGGSQGKWIITTVACDFERYFSPTANNRRRNEVVNDPQRNFSLYSRRITPNNFRSYGAVKKGFQVEVKKGEEWKCIDLLSTIVDKLYQFMM